MAILTFVIAFDRTIRALVIPPTMVDPTANDPPIGARIDLPATDMDGLPIQKSANTLLIFAGSCAGCSVNSVAPGRFARAPQKQVVIVFLASKEQIRAEIQNDSPMVRVVADPLGNIRAQLRAYEAPRFYIVEAGRLRQIWKHTTVWPIAWTGEAPS